MVEWSDHASQPHSHPVLEERERAANAGRGSILLLDLSRQQRNLQLLRPIFQLEFNKHHYVDEFGKKIFEDIDTTYLCLHVLDYLMEGMAISMGRTATEVQAYLVNVAQEMNPRSLSQNDAVRIADIAFAALTNASDNYTEFECEFFDAQTKSNLRSRFRLIRVAPDSEDIYRYQPTEEGYLVYLGMLDLAPEDSAELMEKMLQIMIDRGRYADALDIAKRARMISIEYRQLIRDKLNQANRAPMSIVWSKTMTPKLNEARAHISSRQREDGRMIDAVQQQLRNAEDFTMRSNLLGLLRTLRNSTEIRTVLVKDVTEAPDKFLDAQKTAFRVRERSELPDIEATLLPELLSKPVEQLAEIADNAIPIIYSAQIPRIFDLNTVVFALLEKQTEHSLPGEADEGELIPLSPPEPMFADSLVDECFAWLNTVIQASKQITLQELILRAQTEGFSKDHRLCMVLMLYRSFAKSDNLFDDTVAQIVGTRFRLSIAEGAELRFEKNEGDHDGDR